MFGWYVFFQVVPVIPLLPSGHRIGVGYPWMSLIPKTIQQGKAQSLRRIEINFHGASTGRFPPTKELLPERGERSPRNDDLRSAGSETGLEGIALTKPPGFRATHIETAAVKWVIRIVELEPYSGTNPAKTGENGRFLPTRWGI